MGAAGAGVGAFVGAAIAAFVAAAAGVGTVPPSSTIFASHFPIHVGNCLNAGSSRAPLSNAARAVWYSSSAKHAMPLRKYALECDLEYDVEYDLRKPLWKSLLMRRNVVDNRSDRSRLPIRHDSPSQPARGITIRQLAGWYRAYEPRDAGWSTSVNNALNGWLIFVFDGVKWLYSESAALARIRR